MNRSSVPNLLSASRLVLAVVLYVLLLLDLNIAFVVLFVLTGLTDALDGYFSRKWRVESRFGARLDSIADYFFFGSIPVWLLLAVPSSLVQELILPITIAVSVTIVYGVMRIRAKKPTYYHLYSAKIATFTSYIMALLVFAGYHHAWPVWIMTALLVIAELEEIAVLAGVNAKPQRRPA